jgi:virginiamycin B lyase
MGLMASIPRSALPFAIALFLLWLPAVVRAEIAIQVYALPAGSGPHDVAPSPEAGGPVWYTAQRQGALGRLDPATGAVDQIPLGSGSAPHGDRRAGRRAVGHGQRPQCRRPGGSRNATGAGFRLPAERSNANLNTAAFDRSGKLWFTGQNGVYGRLDPETGEMRVWDAPEGRGPYGITATPDGAIYYASLAGDHIARIDTQTGVAEVIEPPTPDQGARRVWSDSSGRVWVSEWIAGQVSVYDPKTATWRSWRLPGERPQAYAVYVDEKDRVWLSDFGANAVVLFEPEMEHFEVFPSDRPNANVVRQILGRPGEVWAPESGTHRLVVYRTGS